MIAIDGEEYACHIVDIRYRTTASVSPDILINLWMPETTIQARIQPLEILNPIRFDQVVGMTGVVQTNWLSWVKAENVKDYSFIFDCESIQSGLYANAHGMDNVFNTRF